MMTADKLAELYKAVLILEEKLEMAKTRLREAQKFDPSIVNDGKKQVELARNALASAQKEFSNGITSFNRIYSNVPFYRFSKTYTVKLETKTVRFHFNQHGVPTIT